MKVAFIIPPVLDKTNSVDRCFGCNYSIYFLPLLPMLYAATSVQQKGNAVSIHDFAALKKSEADFRAFIQNDNSEVYVFYTVFLSQKTDLIARDIIRSMRKDVKFIFSGPQATYDANSFLDSHDTVAVRGEPDVLVANVIDAILQNKSLHDMPSVSYFTTAGIVNNSAGAFIHDLDSIPIPDRSLLDHAPYYNPKLRHMPHTAALTSRGCFGQCWYCVPNSLSYTRELEHKQQCGKKPPARIHSSKRVIEEFTLIAKQGFKSVSIIDDEFLWDEARTLEICEGIKNLGLEWSCLCRPEMISDKVATAMKHAGCAYVDLGTESFDTEVLKAIKKDMSPDDTRRAVEILKKHKIQVEINVLFGATPVETKETIKKTLREVKKLNVDYVLFSIANPFPGTDFYKAAKKDGWLYYGEYRPVDPAKDAIISYPHLTKKELEQFCAYAYLSYYFSPRYIFKQLLNVKSPKDFFNKVSTAVVFFTKNFLRKT